MASPGPDSFRVCFPPTAWDLVRRAQAAPVAERRASTDELLRRYWRPIYGFFRAQGKPAHEAEELVQGFLYSLLAADKLADVEQHKGRFRDWLLAAARNYMIDAWRRAGAQIRQPAEGLVSFEQLRRADGEPFEPAVTDDPQQAFHEAWRRDLLDRALAAVAAEARRLGREVDFQIFADYYLCDEEARPTWEAIAARYELPNLKAATHRAEWVKRQLARAIRTLIAAYAPDDDAIDDELYDLFD